MPKGPPLLAEDGAVFVGEIATVGGKFRASCHAEHNHLSHYEVEEQRMYMADTLEEAKAWNNDIAAKRGFKIWQNRSGK
jgi:hypothetical protein